MRVVALRTIKEFVADHVDARSSLEKWYAVVKAARWLSAKDVLASFNTADPVGSDRVVFNIKHNSYRLVAAIRYDLQIVWIKFLGTHAEYDKINAATYGYEPKKERK